MATPLPATTGQVDSIQQAPPRPPTAAPPGRISSTAADVLPPPTRQIRDPARNPRRVRAMAPQTVQTVRQNPIVTTNTQGIARAVQAPKKWVYFPLIAVAIGADILGVFAQVANLTGIGALFVSGVSLCISGFFFAVSIVLRRTISRTQNVGGALVAQTAVAQRRIAIGRQIAARTARILRRTPGGRGAAPAIRLVGRWTKNLSRSLRYLQVVLEALPFINLLPWYTVSMAATYREHQQEYQATLAASGAYASAITEEATIARTITSPAS